ncbi:hypothetical protein KAJ38_02405 [Candidatus Pacearchaeota archaeon]|nr:hypothetical protein [Candidatus Pacearchaeota archaeon]
MDNKNKSSSGSIDRLLEGFKEQEANEIRRQIHKYIIKNKGLPSSLKELVTLQNFPKDLKKILLEKDKSGFLGRKGFSLKVLED